jgi:hypothetical protein
MDLRVILFGIGATFIGYSIWRRGSRASSLIRGTATAKIATAAKGYAEIQGRVSAPSSGPLLDPITKHPCVWFSIVTEKFSILDKCRWRTVKTARSSRPFVIDDGSGRCLVSPSDIDIDEREENTIVKDRWNLRHKVWWIREGDPVFAIGYLQRNSDLTAKTILREPGLRSSDEDALTQRATQILRTWKRNPEQLMTRFDADGDGKIDTQEWETVRAAARTEAGGATQGPADVPVDGDVTHSLKKPADGRPFLLSTHGEASLVSRNRSSSFWGLVFFVIGVITLLTLLHSCIGGN